MTLDEKKVLGAVFSLSLGGKGTTVPAVAKALGTGRQEAGRMVEKEARSGLLVKVGGGLKLTKKGRKRIRVVFIGGGFEVIHRGHLYTIQKAKSLGDVLVVSVARDATIRRRKEREPIANERDRQRMLSSLRQVDVAILGVKGNIYDTLERVGPDVVALGYDQHHSESEILREASRRGLKVEVVRLDSPFPRIKTSSILNQT